MVCLIYIVFWCHFKLRTYSSTCKQCVSLAILCFRWQMPIRPVMPSHCRPMAYTPAFTLAPPPVQLRRSVSPACRIFTRQPRTCLVIITHIWFQSPPYHCIYTPSGICLCRSLQMLLVFLRGISPTISWVLYILHFGFVLCLFVYEDTFWAKQHVGFVPLWSTVLQKTQ
jgi:hypothetical protein